MEDAPEAPRRLKSRKDFNKLVGSAPRSIWKTPGAPSTVRVYGRRLAAAGKMQLQESSWAPKTKAASKAQNSARNPTFYERNYSREGQKHACKSHTQGVHGRAFFSQDSNRITSNSKRTERGTEYNLKNQGANATTRVPKRECGNSEGATDKNLKEEQKGKPV